MSDNSELKRVRKLLNDLVELALHGDRELPLPLEREVGKKLDEICTTMVRGLVTRMREESCRIFDNVLGVSNIPAEDIEERVGPEALEDIRRWDRGEK